MKDLIRLAMFSIVLFVLLLILPKNALAQSLYLSPSSGEFNDGAVFTVKLKLDSGGKTINAAQATINFPGEFLELKNISKSGSVFVLWPEEPVFSNSSGTITFSGGVPAPGFSGTGTIININFKTKKAGKAVLSFQGGLILAADGRGTNVLSDTSGATYIINSAASLQEKTANKPIQEKLKTLPDTNPPEPFDIIVDNKGDLTFPSPFLIFEAIDKESGIKEYSIEMDGKNIALLPPEKASPYALPPGLPAFHNVKVKAIDKSGNIRESEANFYIKTIPPPEILIYPESYNAGDEMLFIEGKSLPDAFVIISFEKDNKVKQWETVSNKDGNWSIFTNDIFKDGVYKLSAKAKDKRGAISDPSKEYEILVVLRGISVGNITLTFKNLAQILGLIIVLIIILILYIYRRIKANRAKIKEDIILTQKDLKNTFDELKEKLSKKIEYFDSKPGLTPREKEILDDILKILNKSEKSVRRDIKEIEKEIK